MTAAPRRLTADPARAARLDPLRLLRLAERTALIQAQLASGYAEIAGRGLLAALQGLPAD